MNECSESLIAQHLFLIQPNHAIMIMRIRTAANTSPTTKLHILLFEKEINSQKTTSIVKAWNSQFPNKRKLHNSRIQLAWAEG